MQREVRKYLYDVSKACEAIMGFTSEKRFEDYKQDLFLRSAVERQLMIIGEALNQAERINPQLSKQITDFRRIVNLRNVIVHGYAVVEDETIWGVVQQELPVLAEEVTAMLGK